MRRLNTGEGASCSRIQWPVQRHTTRVLAMQTADDPGPRGVNQGVNQGLMARGLVAVTWFAIAAWGSGHAPVAAQDRSDALRELVEAEALFYEADYDEAMRRIAISAKAMPTERRTGNADFGGTDPPLVKGSADILKGQIYLEQGFLADADSLIKRGKKQIEDRRIYWINKMGRNNVHPDILKNMLFPFYFNEGYAEMLRGEVAMDQAWLKATEKGEKPILGTAREHLERGVFIIKDGAAKIFVGSTGGIDEYYDARRTWFHARLREIQLLIEDDDIRRARELMKDLQADVRGDYYWLLTFYPNAAPARPPVQANAGGQQQGNPNNPPPGDQNTEAETTPDGNPGGDAAGSRDSSRSNRMKNRMARFYAEMLQIESELIRREAEFLKKPELVVKAEETAGEGRDIADEKFWGTPLVAEAAIAHGNALLDTYQLHANGERLKGSFDFGGRQINVHDRRLNSYLEDVDDLIEQATLQLEPLSLSHGSPVRLRLLLLQQRLAAIAPEKIAPAAVAAGLEDFYQGPRIRSFLAQHPMASTAEIVSHFESRKIEVSPACIDRIRLQAAKPESKLTDKPRPTSSLGKHFDKPPRPKGEPPNLVGMEVVQIRGNVAATDGYIASSREKPNHFWRLSPLAAVGSVLTIAPDGATAVVEFPRQDGWERVTIQDTKNSYSSRNLYTGEWTFVVQSDAKFVRLDPEVDGLLLSGEASNRNPQPGSAVAAAGPGDTSPPGTSASPDEVAPAAPPPPADAPAADGGVVDGGASPPSNSPPAGATLNRPIRVNFPLPSIALRPPKPGEVVTRGPDWNKGNADGGEKGMTGKLIRWPDGSLRNDAGYVRVRWDATQRVTSCRWAVRGLFDVWPITEERALEQQLGNEPELPKPAEKPEIKDGGSNPP